MKVLITGGAGFIGSHLGDRLVAEGHELVVIDDLSRGYRERVPTGATFLHQNVADPETVSLVEGVGADVVVHLAAQLDVRRSMRDPAYDARVNVLGSLHVIEGARRGGAGQFVFASSGGAVYGEGAPLPTPESALTEPCSIYGASKLAVEKYLHVYHLTYGFSYAAMRFANVYGPRQETHGEAGVVAIFCERLLRRQDCTIYGDGLQTRDYTYVLDVVDACMRAMPLRGANAFNIGTGVETDVVTLHRVVVTAAGLDVSPRFEPARVGEQQRSAVDAAHAQRTLGWRPHFALDAGVADTVAWFRQRLQG